MANPNIRTIGSSGSEDFATTQAWETATDNDLVTATEGEVGRVTAGDTVDGGVDFGGATTDASFFRTLDADGASFDIHTGQGATLRSTSATEHIVRNFDVEDYTVIEGLRLFRDTTTPDSVGSRHLISWRVGGNSRIKDLTLMRTTASSAHSVTNNRALESSRRQVGDVIEVINVVTIGNGANTGILDGPTGSPGTNFTNCTSYNLFNWGILFSGGSSSTSENNISMSAGSNDFVDNDGSNDFNLSSDATAPGASSHINEDVADIFEDAANNDFRIVRGSNAHEGGNDRSSLFTNDIRGLFRPQGPNWDIGAYELLLSEDYLRRYEHSRAPNTLLRM